MKILFIADPLAGFKIKKDSTFAMMEAAAARQHAIYFCEARDIAIEGGRIQADVVSVSLTGKDGKDWPDNARRFAALGKAAADVAGGINRRYRADVLHCHDWQAALAPAYLRYHGAGGAASALTSVVPGAPPVIPGGGLSLGSFSDGAVGSACSPAKKNWSR